MSHKFCLQPSITQKQAKTHKKKIVIIKIVKKTKQNKKKKNSQYYLSLIFFWNTLRYSLIDTLQYELFKHTKSMLKNC